MFLSTLKRLVRRTLLFRGRNQKFSGLDYWNARAKEYGRRAVLNIGHQGEIEVVTRHQLDIIFPYLTCWLRSEDKIVLDFGCGPGRFTGHLARLINGTAIGVDPVRVLIDLAPTESNVEYRISDGYRIPIPDVSVDVAWVCLVLGGLSDTKISETVSELGRILRPGGLLFLVENTSNKQNCPHWIFRPVEDYQKMFPFAPLMHLHDYEDLGERISIMAGRKN